jgi:hypothetical protein
MQAIFKKALSNVSYHPMGENSPNLGTQNWIPTGEGAFSFHVWELHVCFKFSK